MATNTLDDGEYVGELNGQGQRHGQGTYTFIDGREYVGGWRNGKQNGTGTYTRRGVKYVGDWKEGQKHGQGTQTKFLKGQPRAKYVGAYMDGKPNGKGIQTLHNGDKYVGGWKDGKKHGQGTFTKADGTSWSGEWKNDKPPIHREGVRGVKDTGITRARKLAKRAGELAELGSELPLPTDAITSSSEGPTLNLSFFDFLDMLEDELWELVESQILELHEYLKGKVNLDELEKKKKKRRHLGRNAININYWNISKTLLPPN